LKSTPEFQRLAKGVSEKGNQFTFLSQRFGQTMVQIQHQAIQMTGKAPPAQKEWLQSFLQPGDAAFAYSVSGNTDTGWLTVGNGNQHPAKTLLAAAIVPVAVVAAIAIPNFIKAREAAKLNQ
jgi:hypothetical protein